MTITYAQLLVVEDVSERRLSLEQAIEDWGLCAVTAVASTQEALDLLKHQAFDIILLEVNLCINHDFITAQQLQNYAVTHEIPVIVLATPEDMPKVSQALQLGAVDYLLLPTDQVMLQARINTYLEKKQSQEQAQSFLQAFQEMKKLADDLRNTILPLGISLSVEKDFNQLLEKIVIEAKAICNADAGTLYLRTKDDKLRFVIARTNSLKLAYGGTTGHPVPFPLIDLYDDDGRPNHHNVASHVALERKSVNIRDVYAVQGFDFSGTRIFDEENHYRSVSCLTVPLYNHEVVGVLQLLNAQDSATGRVMPFNMYHQRVAESLASQAAVVIRNQQLRRKEQRYLQFQRDLRIGREIQLGFLPATLPQPPNWEIEALFEPAREVSGDFYDVFMMPHNKVGFVIADVCDKGVPAALFMALVRSLIRANIQQYYYLLQHHGRDTGLLSTWDEQRPFQDNDFNALESAVNLTNVYIGGNHSEAYIFVTAFVGVLDPVAGQLIYINGGHLPPVIFNENGIQARLQPTGPAVGLTPNVNYEIGQYSMQKGDSLVAFTDGITEARSADGAFFTEARLLDQLPSLASSAKEIVAQVHREVKAHSGDTEPFDDLTMLALHFQK